jgi:hypothetical protein
MKHVPIALLVFVATVAVLAQARLRGICACDAESAGEVH